MSGEGCEEAATLAPLEGQHGAKRRRKNGVRQSEEVQSAVEAIFLRQTSRCFGKSKESVGPAFQGIALGARGSVPDRRFRPVHRGGADDSYVSDALSLSAL